jgi:hypothetical protein
VWLAAALTQRGREVSIGLASRADNASFIQPNGVCRQHGLSTTLTANGLDFVFFFFVCVGVGIHDAFVAIIACPPVKACVGILLKDPLAAFMTPHNSFVLVARLFFKTVIAQPPVHVLVCIVLVYFHVTALTRKQVPVFSIPCQCTHNAAEFGVVITVKDALTSSALRLFFAAIRTHSVVLAKVFLFHFLLAFFAQDSDFGQVNFLANGRAERMALYGPVTMYTRHFAFAKKSHLNTYTLKTEIKFSLDQFFNGLAKLMNGFQLLSGIDSRVGTASPAVHCRFAFAMPNHRSL